MAIGSGRRPPAAILGWTADPLPEFLNRIVDRLSSFEKLKPEVLDIGSDRLHFVRKVYLDEAFFN